jgi:hypothetical protein
MGGFIDGLDPGNWGKQGTGGNFWGTFDPGNWGIGKALGIGDNDPANQYRNLLVNSGQGAQGFAGSATGQFNQDSAAAQAQRQFLMDQMQGKNSVSAEQLRQGLSQQLAQQQAMAAGAAPQNAAMAARNAAMNMGQASYGMAGQQAIAGLQERQNAANQLAQLNLGMRGQDVQGVLGGYGAANQAYGSALGTPQQTFGTMIGGALGGLAGGVGKAISDERLKRDVVAEDDDDSKTRTMLKNLKAYSFKYKDERFGKGEQFGVMAQDMEKAGLGHAVENTPYGKVVDGAKTATSALALTASLAKRLDALEGKGRRAGSED